MRTIPFVMLLALAATASTTANAQTPGAQTGRQAADAPDVCDPRAQANSTPTLSPAFQPSWLIGRWRITTFITGRGVRDTVISGVVLLRQRVIVDADSVFLKNTPLIGHSNLEIEYVPGIEPFRTPVDSRSDNFPGVELRMEASGPRLVFGSPTAISQSIVSLGLPRSASFELTQVFSHDFRGHWSLTGTAPDRPRGGFCAVRLTDG